MPQCHAIAPPRENIVWGYVDAAVPAVLRVTSGDTVPLTSWAAAAEEDLAPDRSLANPGHLRALANACAGRRAAC